MKTNKHIERVYSTHVVSGSDKMKIPKDVLDKIVKNQLAQGIANLIVDGLDNLPISYTIEYDDITNSPAERHAIKMNLISDDELKRLKKVECMYNSLCK